MTITEESFYYFITDLYYDGDSSVESVKFFHSKALLVQDGTLASLFGVS
jgi:hypothetical protein